MNHRALPNPQRSWLRKMSLNTMINSQIQMNQEEPQHRPRTPGRFPTRQRTVAQGLL